MSLVAGVDCSTQSTKVVVCDADTGEVVREGRADHPDVTEVDARVWWQAWEQASAGLLDGVAAISVAGQQHGMVLVDESGTPVRDALLWNDNRSAPQAAALIDELGGPHAWADATGSVPVASFTVTKLRWVADHESDVADRAQGVLLPHDWVTHQLRGGAGEPTTDRGDASGTGYWSAADDAYRPDLLRTAFGRDLAVPRVAAPHEAVGETPEGIVLAPGTGDNMGAALGLDLEPGDVVVSLGTSGTVFAVSDRPTSDATGIVAGFADATGRFLPLVCTLNAARVIGAAPAAGGCRARRPRPARAVGRRHGRAGAAAVPRRRAHAGAARRDRPAARPDPGQRDAGPPGPRRGRGHALRARRRRRPARGRPASPRGASC